METKIENKKMINGIEYIVYEAGMLINDPEKSFYIKENLDYDWDLVCKHLYATKNIKIHGNQHTYGNQYVSGNHYAYGHQYVVGGNDYVRGNQYVDGNQSVSGNQDIGGDQYIRGNQYIGGNQDVGGNQYVGGNQDVRYIYVYLYCKYPIRLDRDSDEIKIGCVSKSVDDWGLFFKNKETINLSSDDRNYKKLESAFNIAKQMKSHLVLMNDKAN